jgi:hypothetical protein
MTVLSCESPGAVSFDISSTLIGTLLSLIWNVIERFQSTGETLNMAMKFPNSVLLCAICFNFPNAFTHFFF